MANYLKQGTSDQFVSDYAEIGYEKFNNLRNTIMGFMLGDYDEQGNYTVDKELVKELVHIRKFVVERIDNMIICHSQVLLEKPITFLVTFEQDCATLSLLEKISHQGNVKPRVGSYSDINEYLLDRVETSGVISQSAIFRRWNISDEPGRYLDIAGLDEETLAELFNLTNRYKKLLYLNTVLLEKEEKLEEEELNYTDELMNLIADYPELQKAVKQTIQQQFKEKKDFIKIDRPFVARSVNEVITQAIEENIKVLKPDELEKFSAVKHDIQNRHNLHMQEILPAVVETADVGKNNTVGVLKADVLGVASSTISELVKESPTAEAPQQESEIKPVNPETLTIKTLREANKTAVEIAEIKVANAAVKAYEAGEGEVDKATENARKVAAVVSTGEVNTETIAEESEDFLMPETKKIVEARKRTKSLIKEATEKADAAAENKPKVAKKPEVKKAAPAPAVKSAGGGGSKPTKPKKKPAKKKTTDNKEDKNEDKKVANEDALKPTVKRMASGGSSGAYRTDDDESEKFTKKEAEYKDDVEDAKKPAKDKEKEETPVFDKSKMLEMLSRVAEENANLEKNKKRNGVKNLEDATGRIKQKEEKEGAQLRKSDAGVNARYTNKGVDRNKSSKKSSDNIYPPPTDSDGVGLH